MNFVNYNKDKADSDDIKFLYFKSNDCGVCVSMLEKMKKEFKDIDLNTYIIQIENFPELRGKYLIFTGPTILLLKNDKILAKESGFVEFENFKKILKFITEK